MRTPSFVKGQINPPAERSAKLPEDTFSPRHQVFGTQIRSGFPVIILVILFGGRCRLKCMVGSNFGTTSDRNSDEAPAITAD